MPRSDDPQPGLGAAIRELRGSMTQEELGHLAGLHPTWISHIESGRSNPSWGNVRRLAAALGVPLAHLAELAESLQPQNGEKPPTP